jgi:LmbE family N-acetylglucosaminyl deacetylase
MNPVSRRSLTGRRCLPLFAVFLLAAAAAVPAFAGPRPPDPLDAAQTQLALQKLRVLGSVLYVAAHPDDENTAMLAWLARERKVRTAYLSMTRGDGGQNLIGTELGPELGVIRTQELLAARRVDGAEQFFTRALDFGFTKNPEETFAFWGRDSILSDVVRVIRRFRPDVIVTRFPTDGSGGHGHHTASAILAEEAFTVAADPKRFPNCGPAWQAKRIFWNAFTPEGRSVDSTWLRVDVGGYNPLLGRSYGEIAAVSRSNHKSQGFGVPERHGPLPNFLALRGGEPAAHDLLDGVELSWRRFAGGMRVDSLLALAESEFDPGKPQALLPRLFQARLALDGLAASREGQPLVRAKRAELDDVIRSCTGLWVEAVAQRPTVTAGESLVVVLGVVNRRGIDLSLTSVEVGSARDAGAADRPVRGVLLDTIRVVVPANAPLTQPYWLETPQGAGRYAVADPGQIGRPEGAPALTARIGFATPDGARFALEIPVSYRWADPVQGERWRALEVAPPATLAFDHGTYVFPDRAAREVNVTVTAQRAGLRGLLRLALPAGWSASPPQADVALAKPGAELRVHFMVTPADGPAAAPLAASVVVDGRAWSHRLEHIDYPHIPMQTLFPPAAARLVRTEIRHTGTRVAYIAGSGDAIPDALHQLDYEVTPLTDDEIESGDLSRFDAIVTGVRAFNTRPRLLALKPKLMAYVQAGGTLLEQYNTTADGPLNDLGPYPFQVSRDRVTVEEAPVRMLDVKHPVLSTPNALRPSDFDGWVQERGLYFANPWDPKYETPLSCNDPGEPARDGGLLYASYGKGVYEYCAYALFRQLPAGVPGAWRLLANLLSARGRAVNP